MRKLVGYALIYTCAALDLVPSYEQKHWYIHGCWGCRVGLAHKGFQLLGVMR